MPTITVQAADSATAMDKIWEQLGPDAMIVSTSKHNGHVVMEATTDSTKPALAPSSEAEFSKIFTSQMLAKPEVKAKKWYSAKRRENVSYWLGRCRHRCTSPRYHPNAKYDVGPRAYRS
jgi:flagellar biosynthesis GTPase FlhF